MLLGRFYGGIQLPIWEWTVIALAIWLGTLIFAALAVALGYKLDPDSVQPVTIVVFFFFSIFGGLWFPLTGALQKFGEFTPTYQIVKITTDVIGQGSAALVNVIGVVVWFAIFVALATLAVYDATALRQALADGDVAALTRVPGIGKRSAERLVLELRDKIGPVGTSVAATALNGHSIRGPVVEALVGLGFAAKQAEEATDKVLTADAEATTSTALRSALSILGKTK